MTKREEILNLVKEYYNETFAQPKEYKEGDNAFLTPIEDDDVKGILLTAFTVNFLDKVYDEV